METILATFCLSIFILLFHLKQQFAAWVLKFQKWHDVDVLDFQSELRYRYFGKFGLETVLAFFAKIWAILFQSSGHPD